MKRFFRLALLTSIAGAGILVVHSHHASRGEKPESAVKQAPSNGRSNLTDGKRQYDAGNPTADEQLLLELINRARSDPTAEGKRLNIDIKEGLSDDQKSVVGPRPPLSMNKMLLAASRKHSADMYMKNYFAHEDLMDRTPGKRMQLAGYDLMSPPLAWGENIAAHSGASMSQLEDQLMVDAGVEGRGHRINLLDIHSKFIFREVGIGSFSGNSRNPSGFRDFLTEDFGLNKSGPFILGVVYKDKNSNHFYDIGEGIAGVSITADQGDYFAVTSKAGGFAIPCPRCTGTVRITASGGCLLAPLTRTTKLNGSNIKLDFVLPH